MLTFPMMLRNQDVDVIAAFTTLFLPCLLQQLSQLSAAAVVSSSEPQLSMLSRSQEYHLRADTQFSLDCEFFMEGFDIFENPTIWLKSQWEERSQIHTMSIIDDSFLKTRRFDVSLIKQPPRFRLLLKIKEVTVEDSGNYTCEVRKRAVVLDSVTHSVHVLDPIRSVVMSTDFDGPNRTTIEPSASLWMNANEAISLECTVNGGFPAPSVEIFLDSRNITDEFQLFREFNKTGEPGFRRINYVSSLRTDSFVTTAFNHGQTVYCVGRVPHLEPVTTKLKLHVVHKPLITCVSRSAHLKDPNVCMHCDVTSRPPPLSIFWSLDDNTGASMRSIETDNNGYWTQVGDRGNGVIEAVLCMNFAKTESFRTYTVVAENTAGRVSQNVELLYLADSKMAEQEVVETKSKSYTGETKNIREYRNEANRGGPTFEDVGEGEREESSFRHPDQSMETIELDKPSENYRSNNAVWPWLFSHSSATCARVFLFTSTQHSFTFIVFLSIFGLSFTTL